MIAPHTKWDFKPAKSAGKLLTGVDTAWLRMESSTNRMMINGVIVLDPFPDIDELEQLFEERLLRHSRFRMRVGTVNGLPVWSEDPDLSISRHIDRSHLSGPEFNHEKLRQFISEEMSVPLSPDRPLWKLILIPYKKNQLAIVVKLHHSIADGIALIKVLLSLARVSPEGAFFEPEDEIVHKPSYGKSGRASAALQRLWGHASGLVHALGKFVFMPSDTPTSLKGNLTPQKEAAWSEPIPLDDIKKLGKKYGATVNDIMLWLVCGALRSYLIETGELKKESTNLRITIPVNLRTGKERDKLGNRFGLVFMKLPVGEPDGWKRLSSIRNQMREIKSSREALVAFGVLAILGRTPKVFEKWVVKFLSSKCSSIVTNVPGPRQPLYIAGSKMSGIMFWVPKSGAVGLGISLLSYNNTLGVGVASDASRIPEPAKVIDAFRKEVSHYLARNKEME